MAILIPAILTKDGDEVEEKIRFLEGIPEITEVHIDFEDGRFVPNDTVMPQALFGLKTRLKIDAHMMVERPQHYFHDLQHLGVSQVDIHYESFKSTDEVLTAVANLKALKLTPAVVINPQTDIAVFDQLATGLEIIFLMSVHPGFQGRPFLPQVLDHSLILRKKFPNAIIQMDGGINSSNIQTVRSHGAERIVVGSGIWHNPDVKKTIYELLEKIK